MQQAFEDSVVFLDSLRFIPSMYTSRLNKPAANGILKKRGKISMRNCIWLDREYLSTYESIPALMDVLNKAQTGL